MGFWFLVMTAQALLSTFFILLQIWGFGFGDDGTGPADETKRTKRVQEWSDQIMEGRILLFAILLLCEITTSFV